MTPTSIRSSLRWTVDRVEEHLGQPGHQPYLFGEHITDREADVRLYTTHAREVATYHLNKFGYLNVLNITIYAAAIFCG
jgi:glutathionyl-hydroquinone reductase